MSERFEGTLKNLTSQNRISSMIFFDTETHIIEVEDGYYEFPLKLGVAIYVRLNRDMTIDYRAVYEFYSVEEFIELLEHHRQNKQLLYIFAHNVGFDIRVLQLPEIFHDLGFTSKPPIINQMAFIWKVSTNQGNMVFLDTANFGVRSVEQLGRDLGLPKIDVDLHNIKDDELMEYCLRDVEILERFILGYLSLIEQYELGSFSYTLASQSLVAYRTKFMHTKPYIHNDEDILDLERQAYHGGRTEAFFIGRIPHDRVYYVDINSMYPYIMKNYVMPIKLLSKGKHLELDYLYSLKDDYYFIISCRLKSSHNFAPLRKDMKLIFPTGEFNTFLHHEEFIYAYENDLILELGQVAMYKPAILFDEYVKFFYSKRLEYKEQGNLSWSLATKLMLNSLYGKFGQKQPHRNEIGECEADIVYRLPTIDLVNNRRYVELGWFGTIYEEFKEGETRYSMPAIAGAVTAGARMLLYKYMRLAGLDNVFYVDTDSLMVNQEGYDRLSSVLDERKLGFLKLEDIGTEVVINGAKDYQFNNSLKLKGVPKKAKQISVNTFEYLQFQGFITWMNNGAIGGANATTRRKRRVSNYNKGEVNEDGSVTPFDL